LIVRANASKADKVAVLRRGNKAPLCGASTRHVSRTGLSICASRISRRPNTLFSLTRTALHIFVTISLKATTTLRYSIFANLTLDSLLETFWLRCAITRKTCRVGSSFAGDCRARAFPTPRRQSAAAGNTMLLSAFASSAHSRSCACSIH
jgi:hypothetical protein